VNAWLRGGITISSLTPVADDAWHHIVAVYDRRDMALYVDGVCETNGYDPSSPTLLPDNEFTVGVIHDLASDYKRYMRGRIDDLRVYGRALTAEQVQRLYVAGGGSDHVSLVVTSDPAPHGTPAPYDYGTNMIAVSTATSNMVVSPADESAGTRYVCTGWTGTGDIPGTGTNTVVSFTVSVNSTLVWHWVAEYLLDTEAGTGGGVDTGDGWYTSGSEVTLTATGMPGFVFDGWTGDVPAGMETSNPLALTMNQARTVTADFAPFNTDGIVLHFTFDDYDGTSVADQSGMGNNGMVHGATFEMNGAIGGAYRFDGNDHVDVVHDASLTFGQTNMFTLSAWVLTDPLTAHHAICSKRRSVSGDHDVFSYGLAIRDDEPPYPDFWVGSSHEGFSRAMGDSVVDNARWHHVVGVYSNKAMGLYIDGVLDTNIVDTMTAVSLPDNEFVIGAGHYSDVYEQFFKGLIDDLRVYSRSLAPEEVMDLYVAGGGSPYVTLAVSGTLAPHGTPAPYDYGTNAIAIGTATSNTVASPADESGGTRYVCTGWTGTGDIPATGTNTTVLFTASVDSTLVWHWAAEYLLDTETAAGGGVDVGDGWYTNGAPVAVEASALAGWLFSGWTGDVPEGMATNNPLTMTMDQPRALQANFTLPFGTIAGTVTYGGTNTGPIRVVASGTAQNRVLELDGDDDVVAVPDSNELDLRDAVTLEARVWFRAIENRDYIVGRLDEDTIPAYRILVLTGGRIGFALDNARRVQGGAVTTGRWYSVAATYDGSRMRVYVDGEQQASAPATGPIDPTTWGSLFMGSKHISGDTYDLELDGYLDEVRVWSRALDADEVRQYATMSPLPGAPGLVGHWNFNDGTAADTTTNANGGTLVGDAAVVPSDDTAAAQYAATIAVPGPYVITNVPTLAFYDVRAYRDRNGDWREDGGDPAGAYPANSVFLTNTVGGVDIELLDKLLDSDSDGLSDYDEVYLDGTNPHLRDTDGDGMADGAELVAGTSPTNADDVFCVTECSSAGATNPLVVCWDTVTGRLYTVNGAEDLLAPSWSNLFQTVGDGSRKCFTNSGSLAPIYFIRLGVEQP